MDWSPLPPSAESSTEWAVFLRTRRPPRLLEPITHSNPVALQRLQGVVTTPSTTGLQHGRSASSFLKGKHRSLGSSAQKPAQAPPRTPWDCLPTLCSWSAFRTAEWGFSLTNRRRFSVCDTSSRLCLSSSPVSRPRAVSHPRPRTLGCQRPYWMDLDNRQSLTVPLVPT